jgi:hypothetical protein
MENVKNKEFEFFNAENYPVLKKIESDRAFHLEISKDKKDIMFVDGCDRYYGSQLTKSEFAGLITELTNVHNQMAD